MYWYIVHAVVRTVLGTKAFRTVLVQESFRTVPVQESSGTVLIQQLMSTVLVPALRTVRIQVTLADMQKQLRGYPIEVQNRCHVCHGRRDECRNRFE
jgi:hypothetical protein